ncbi:MAG TPA: sialidase family protein, partial [Steroidobacteraceae bacterium]|nr:sialidase family protein [Steroidobacteraceae bacterium]
MSEAVDRSCAIVPIVALLGLSCLSCGGDADRAGVETPAAPVVPAVRLSGESTFASDCSANQIGTLYRNAEVEPYFAVNPTSPANVVAMWQQDRWSNGAAQGLVAAASFDGGRSWSSASLPFSVCAGGSAVNGGNFARASDPWLSFSPDGVLYALGLVLDRGVSTADAKSGMLVARSFDGGLTWTDPAAVIAEPGPATNDKGSITADPHDPRFAYVVW